MKTNNKFNFIDINDTTDKLTNEQKLELLNYSNSQNIEPIICCWYNNKDYFINKWNNYGYDYSSASKLLKDKQFFTFSNGEIVRLVI